MLSARSHEAKPGVNGGKGAPERSGGAFIGAERKPLRRRGCNLLQRASRSASALDCPCEHQRAGQPVMVSGRRVSRAKHDLRQRRLMVGMGG